MARYPLSMKPDFTRSAMSPRERELRSRAVQLLSGAGLLHGSWIERQRGCGRKTCHCAQPGDPRHHSTYVYRQHEGKLRQLYVSKVQRETTRRWLDHDSELHEILQALWEIHWQRVRGGEAKD